MDQGDHTAGTAVADLDTDQCEQCTTELSSTDLAARGEAPVQSPDVTESEVHCLSKAGGSGAAVQRRHSLLPCGRTVNLQLHLLQAVLVPVLQYGCETWRMHSPRVAAANRASDCNCAIQIIPIQLDYLLPCDEANVG